MSDSRTTAGPAAPTDFNAVAYRAPVTFARAESNPILTPNPKNDWEALVTTNPSAVFDESRGKFVLLYRAAGHDAEHAIFIGLAESDDGEHFTRVSDHPVFSPSTEGAYDAGGAEDPRVMRVGEWYLMTYASRAYHAGQYWLMAGNPYKPPSLPDDFPLKFRKNLTTTSLAATKDFRTWRRCGPLTDPRFDDRDVYFIPERVNGKWWMIHRPMEWAGPGYGTDHPAMWVNESDDLLHWDSSTSTLLAKAEQPWEVKIGGNTTAIRTELGWFTLYHGKGPDGYYRLGAMILDPTNPRHVTHRTKGWLMQPEESYETEGCYDMGGVVFPCGTVLRDDTLFMYYGGADKYVGLARISMSELLDYLRACPV